MVKPYRLMSDSESVLAWLQVVSIQRLPVDAVALKEVHAALDDFIKPTIPEITYSAN